MRVGFYHLDKNLCRDEVIFNYGTPLRLDDPNKKMAYLYEALKSLGISLSCVTDVKNVANFDYFLVGDIDVKRDYLSKKILGSKSKKILLLEECDVIRPDLWDRKLWNYFDKVISWNDNLQQEDKLQHSNFFCKSNFVGGKFFTERKLACMISANKVIKHKDELYSERLKVIEWYEKNNIENFDLYGFSWDQRPFDMNGDFLKYLNGRRFKWLRKFLAQKRKSWKGVVTKKSNVLCNYKFCYAFENAKNRNGYILEKIFDPMFSGCIPIYWGASNIEHYIPKDTFIDFRKFRSISECNDFISSISEKEHSRYVESIKNFIES